MTGWRAVSSVLLMMVSVTAHAQTRPALWQSGGHFSLRTARASLPGRSWINDPAPFAGGMISTDNVSPDAMLGVGLVKMHGRERNGSDMRVGAPEVDTRNPAVTFVVKF